MIRDLEALTLTIPKENARDYITESIRCYSAGAYRAAVVIAVAAGMHDLREKLSDLVASRGATPDLVTLHQNIERLYNAQEAFERQLIEGCERHANLLTPPESRKLILLLQTRHLCAHPSGHPSSAEEARDCITSIIDVVLSKASLMGLVAVTSIIDRLASNAFFPRPGDIEHVTRVTSSELAVLREALLPALVLQL